MKYFKTISGGFIRSVSTMTGDTEITEAEYAEIMDAIHNRPTPPEGYDYWLKTDLTWELVELPEEEEA